MIVSPGWVARYVADQRRSIIFYNQYQRRLLDGTIGLLYHYALTRTGEEMVFTDLDQSGRSMPCTELSLWIEQSRNGIEVWRPIPRFEGRYEASNLGRLRNLDRIVHKRIHGVISEQFYKGRIIGGKAQSDGYCLATLGGKKGGRWAIHRMVLEAFVGDCPAGMEGCHGDGKPSNNALYNLRWDTHFANNQDRKRHGNYAVGESHPMSKITEEKARLIAADERKTRDIVAAYGVSKNMVYRIKSKTSWSHLDAKISLPPGRQDEDIPRGEKHPSSKLNEEDIRQIRSSSKNQYELADQYGVTQSAISCVKRGITWKNVL